MLYICLLTKYVVDCVLVRIRSMLFTVGVMNVFYVTLCMVYFNLWLLPNEMKETMVLYSDKNLREMQEIVTNIGRLLKVKNFEVE